MFINKLKHFCLYVNIEFVLHDAVLTGIYKMSRTRNWQHQFESHSINVIQMKKKKIIINISVVEKRHLGFINIKYLVIENSELLNFAYLIRSYLENKLLLKI